MSKRSKLLLPSLAIVGLLPFVTVSSVFASDDEERLMMDVFKGYNSLILPLRNDSQPITVRMTLQLVLLINVDEKDQIMHTNVWLTLKWKDFQMAWSPVNYGGIKEFRVSPDKVWLPDIVLFNNADGNYEVSFMSNVIIDYRGNVLWVPPAIYKSSCIIDVEYFPFDEQVCHLVFGSWTYNENEIKMEFEQADSMDLSEYAKSVSSIWDVIDAPASLVNRRSRIEYQLRIRRKTLFYTVVLIIPTVLMAFLSMAVFFLPTDSGEKMTLTISVLLSIVVFLLVVSKILPPTSSTIPLISKYLLLTFVLNIVTITVTVVIINVYHRGPTTHRMPRWVRFVFLKAFFSQFFKFKFQFITWPMLSLLGFCSVQLMPHLLCMKRPSPAINRLAWHAAEGGDSDGLTTLPGVGQFTVPLNVSSAHHPNCPAAGKSDNKMEQKNNNEGESANEEQTEENDGGKAIKAIPLSAEAVRAVHSIEYITEHMRREEKHKTHRDDWKYVAMVIDRFLLYVFFGVTLGGTIGVLLSAPTVFESVDQQAVLQRLIQAYNSGGRL